MMSDSLPGTWTSLPLEALFEAITDGDHQPPPQVESGVPFLVIGNVRHGRLDFSDVRFVPVDYFRSLAAHRRPRLGDVLYTVTGSFGIPVLVSEDRDFCVQRHIAILRPHRITNGRYVVAALSTGAAFEQAKSAATGTAQKTVGLARLRKITIPVAPVSEQQRIVEALDSYLSRLDSAVTSLQKVQAKLKAYRASVLKAAVEGRLVPTEAEIARREGRDYEPASVLLARILKERRRRWEEAELARMKKAGKTPKDDAWKKKYEEPEAPDTSKLPSLPEGWCWASVEQVAEVGTGATPNRSVSEYWEAGTVPWVTSAAAALDVVSEASELVTELALAETNLTLYPPNTLILAMYGEGKTRGRCSVLGIAATTNQALAALVTLGSAQGIRDWLKLFMDFNYDNVRRQSAGGVQPNLNLSIVRSISFPLPPLAAQARLVAEADRQLSVAKMLEEDVRRQLSRTSRLRQSVLKWAFEGKLVDQDPSDEPAEELLARIRAERAAAPTTKTRGRKAKSS